MRDGRYRRRNSMTHAQRARRAKLRSTRRWHAGRRQMPCASNAHSPSRGAWPAARPGAQSATRRTMSTDQASAQVTASMRLLHSAMPLRSCFHAISATNALWLAPSLASPTRLASRAVDCSSLVTSSNHCDLTSAVVCKTSESFTCLRCLPGYQGDMCTDGVPGQASCQQRLGPHCSTLHPPWFHLTY
jgi:hypothetical protein